MSVVIPTVRLDPYLNEAVESVLASTGIDLELLVVHDGVTPDHTLPWMSDPRVRVITFPERRGVSTAMQAGVDAASHAYIARLDGDDLSWPKRLATQSDYLDANPLVVGVGSRVMRIDPSGKQLSELPRPVGQDVRTKMLLQNVVAHSSLMFRADAGRRAGGYAATLAQMEDYDFLLRLSTVGAVGNIDEVLVSYRVHPAQASRGAKPWGKHINVVMAGRRALRRELRRSRAMSLAKDAVWGGVQYLRYFGVIRPGYER